MTFTHLLVLLALAIHGPTAPRHYDVMHNNARTEITIAFDNNSGLAFSNQRGARFIEYISTAGQVNVMHRWSRKRPHNLRVWVTKEIPIALAVASTTTVSSKG